MEKVVRVFEPAMCCASGLCGPTPDEKMVAFNDLIKKIEAEGYMIERLMITQDFEKFKAEPEIMALIDSEELDALPITVVGKKIIKKGAYPVYEDIVGLSV